MNGALPSLSLGLLGRLGGAPTEGFAPAVEPGHNVFGDALASAVGESDEAESDEPRATDTLELPGALPAATQALLLAAQGIAPTATGFAPSSASGESGPNGRAIEAALDGGARGTAVATGALGFGEAGPCGSGGGATHRVEDSLVTADRNVGASADGSADAMNATAVSVVDATRADGLAARAAAADFAGPRAVASADGGAGGSAPGAMAARIEGANTSTGTAAAAAAHGSTGTAARPGASAAVVRAAGRAEPEGVNVAGTNAVNADGVPAAPGVGPHAPAASPTVLGAISNAVDALAASDANASAPGASGPHAAPPNAQVAGVASDRAVLSAAAHSGTVSVEGSPGKAKKKALGVSAGAGEPTVTAEPAAPVPPTAAVLDAHVKTLTSSTSSAGETRPSADPAPPQRDLESAVRDAEAVGHKRFLGSKEARGHVVIPDLGRIEVRARLEEGSAVAVHVQADDADTRAVIAAHAPELRAHVQAEVPQAQVTVDQRQTSSDRTNSGNSQHEHREAPDRREDAREPEAVKKPALRAGPGRARFVL